MTLDELTQLLGALPAHSIRADGPTAGTVLRSIENLADANPQDRRLAKLVHDVSMWASATQGVPVTFGDVRREQLIRWDQWTTTWTGADTQDGSQLMVRILRPGPDADPVMRRQLAREAKALAGIVAGITLVQGDLLGIRVPLPGEPLTPETRQSEIEDMLHTRLLATGLVAVAAWEERGLSLPILTREELRNCGDRLAITCLTPGDGADHQSVLATIASLLGHHETSSLGELRLALSAAPPTSAHDAEQYAIKAMAQDLAARRHSLYLRHIRGRHQDRIARFHALIVGLQASVPRPLGVGAVGVDMDGAIQVVHSDNSGISWRSTGESRSIFTEQDGFVAPEARRLLRSRAAAPNSERLQADVGGDSAFTDAIGQWVSAALKLRTVRMLLEKSV